MGAERTTTEKQTTNRSIQFPPSDKSVPYRIVGSYEYVNAIESLERLIAISNTEELATYDRFLEDRPEFTYFSGLAEQFGLPSGDLTKHPQFEIAGFKNRYEKKGLAAMLALAKVEIGATISMYGKSREPFNEFGPLGQLDYQQMISIIADDVHAHMYSLEKEKEFKKVLRGPLRTATVNYLRRLKLIKDMIDVLKATGTISEFKGMSKHRKTIKLQISVMRSNIMAYAIGEDESSTTTSTSIGNGGHLHESARRCREYLNRIGAR